MKPRPADPPEQVLARIEDFIRACREPAVFESGEKAIPLEAGRWDLQRHGDAVVLHAWNVQGSLVRRIVGVRDEQPGRRLTLAIRGLRLGGNRGEGAIQILDLARAGAHQQRREDRHEFRERFARLLEREFPEWKIAQISADPDLEHSLSDAFARALLTQAGSAFAAIAASETAGSDDCDHILSAGLIWLDYLRARQPQRPVRGLKLFVPHKRKRFLSLAGQRLRWLDPACATYELYRFAPDGSVARVDEKDYGNLAGVLPPAMPPPELSPQVTAWVERLASRFPLQRVPTTDGRISLRFRGVEFARASAAGLTSGPPPEQRPVTPANWLRLEQLAAHLAASEDREAPEQWLESLLRADPSRVSSALASDPLYCQVSAVAGLDRGILDLLGCDSAGRLVILELKASADFHLPLQGLDYWIRVKGHLDRGDFPRQGYFPGMELDPRAPRLLLVSPVFEFHSTTEAILRYFSPQVEVERVGLGVEWRKELKVVFRARGADRPFAAAGAS